VEGSTPVHLRYFSSSRLTSEMSGAHGLPWAARSMEGLDRISLDAQPVYGPLTSPAPLGMGAFWINRARRL